MRRQSQRPNGLGTTRTAISFLLGFLLVAIIPYAEAISPHERITTLEGRVTTLEEASNGLAVFDSLGEKVGDFVSVNGVWAWVALNVDGFFFVVGVTTTGYMSGVTSDADVLVFALDDCLASDPPFIQFNPFQRDLRLMPMIVVNAPGNTVYRPDFENGPQTISGGSSLTGDECNNDVGAELEDAFPAIPVINLDDFFVGPFTLRELE